MTHFKGLIGRIFREERSEKGEVRAGKRLRHLKIQTSLMLIISLQTIFQFQQLVFFHFKLLILGLAFCLVFASGYIVILFQTLLLLYFIDASGNCVYFCRLALPWSLQVFTIFILNIYGRQPPTIFAILQKGCRTNFPVYKSGVGPYGLIHAWTTSRSWHDIASILLTTSCQELNSPWNFKEGTYSYLKSNRTYPFGRKTSNSPKSNYI